MAAGDLTAARVRELLNYDPDTGIFIWRAISSTLSRKRIGDIAGGKTSRCYLCIGIDGASHMSHRLAWLYMTGEWPPHHIDHIDGDGRNNRWSNLRSATNAENMQNAVRPLKVSSPLRGAYPHSGRWASRLFTNGRAHYLGMFGTAEEAHAAYMAARQRMFLFQPIPRDRA